MLVYVATEVDAGDICWIIGIFPRVLSIGASAAIFNKWDQGIS